MQYDSNLIFKLSFIRQYKKITNMDVSNFIFLLLPKKFSLSSKNQLLKAK